jgi:hypothetical protein
MRILAPCCFAESHGAENRLLTTMVLKTMVLKTRYVHSCLKNTSGKLMYTFSIWPEH